MLKPNKRLGQHFLKNAKILEEIADSAELTKSDTVLEVGPGTGTLTEVLAVGTKKVIAVEKDRNLIPILREKFKNTKNVEIIEGDILKLTSPLAPLLTKERGFKVVANIPYYITSRFLRLFLSETKFRTKLMVLMVQKEVAERITAKDGKESVLSLSVKAYGKPKIVRNVSKNFFSPPPKMDSAVIKIDEISDKWFKNNKIPEEKFFEVLHAAFRQKRKMLRHSLSKTYKIPPEFAEKRPEKLRLEDWLSIFRVK